MRVQSNTLTKTDLYAAIEDGGPVFIDELTETEGRKRARSFIVYLEAQPGKGRRPRHNRRGYSATYVEHGEWMARLFGTDPDACIAGYNGVDDFHDKTKGDFV